MAEDAAYVELLAACVCVPSACSEFCAACRDLDLECHCLHCLCIDCEAEWVEKTSPSDRGVSQ